MKIGIISDTHDDVATVKKAVEIFKERGVSLVFHLGDYVSPPIVRLLKGLKVIGIFGNNDGYREKLIEAFKEIEGEIKGGFAEIEIEHLKIALYHGEFREISEALAKSGKYDVVFAGHFHKFEELKFGNTLLINPGAAHRYFTLDEGPKVGIFDTKLRKYESITLSLL
jgi:putative phosphoesterase